MGGAPSHRHRRKHWGRPRTGRRRLLAGPAVLVRGQVHGLDGSPILETVVSISIRILPVQPVIDENRTSIIRVHQWVAGDRFPDPAGLVCGSENCRGRPRWPLRGLVRWQRCDRRLRERRSGGSRDCHRCSARGVQPGARRLGKRSPNNPHNRRPLTSERLRAKPSTGRFGCSASGLPTATSMPT
jgi:hypothetical protein